MPDHSFSNDETRTNGPSSSSLKRYGVGAAVMAVAIVGYGVVSRDRATDDLRTVASDSSLPVVSIVHPVGGKGADPLALPGNVEAFNTAAIYARTNGYVREWLVDLGDRVRTGQALAVLEAADGSSGS